MQGGKAVVLVSCQKWPEMSSDMFVSPFRDERMSLSFNCETQELLTETTAQDSHRHPQWYLKYNNARRKSCCVGVVSKVTGHAKWHICQPVSRWEGRWDVVGDQARWYVVMIFHLNGKVFLWSNDVQEGSVWMMISGGSIRHYRNS